MSALEGFHPAVARWFEGQIRPNPDKRARIRDSAEIYQLGFDLMEHPKRAGNHGSILEAVDYRDGLIIAMLAARPVRLRNLSGIVIGQNLIRVDAAWYLVFTEQETKTSRAIEFQLPERLTPYLERYLSEFRPRFPGAATHNQLWASREGGPLTAGAISRFIGQRTERAFGRAINPHLFRDCAATSLALFDPEHVYVAAALLGHSTLEATHRYYNQATTISALEDHQDVILKRRAELAERNRRAR